MRYRPTSEIFTLQMSKEITTFIDDHRPSSKTLLAVACSRIHYDHMVISLKEYLDYKHLTYNLDYGSRSIRIDHINTDRSSKRIYFIIYMDRGSFRKKIQGLTFEYAAIPPRLPLHSLNEVRLRFRPIHIMFKKESILDKVKWRLNKWLNQLK